MRCERATGATGDEQEQGGDAPGEGARHVVDGIVGLLGGQRHLLDGKVEPDGEGQGGKAGRKGDEVGKLLLANWRALVLASQSGLANTATTSGLKSSGTQKLRPSRKAIAWPARYSICEPRGETPSENCSDSRVSRTIAST